MGSSRYLLGLSLFLTQDSGAEKDLGHASGKDWLSHQEKSQTCVWRVEQQKEDAQGQRPQGRRDTFQGLMEGEEANGWNEAVG